MKRWKQKRMRSFLLGALAFFGIAACIEVLFGYRLWQAILFALSLALVWAVCYKNFMFWKGGVSQDELDAILIELPAGEEILSESKARLAKGSELVPGKVFLSENFMVFKSIDLGEETVTLQLPRAQMPKLDKGRAGFLSLRVA